MRNFENERERQDDLATEHSGAENQSSIVTTKWWKWISGIIGAVIILALILPLFSCGEAQQDTSSNEEHKSTPSASNSASPVDPDDSDLNAPEFSLMNANNSPVSLANILSQNQAVVIVFYRGFF